MTPIRLPSWRVRMSGHSAEGTASLELSAVPAIEERIFVVRGRQVMLDEDLADLYGVETKRLVEQVKRNVERFPADFMFQLDEAEAAAWPCFRACCAAHVRLP